MRLLSTSANGKQCLTHFFNNAIPSHAILSHTWDEDDQEVTFHDLMNGLGRDKRGYRKIRFCSEQAEKDGLRYFWVDSCCIDKSSSAELSEAINSMFRYYRDAAKCYVYLSDVSTEDPSQRLWEPAFSHSRWFTRGWTLQELLAPRSVEFFSVESNRLGNKDLLEEQIHEITGIPIDALRGNVSQFKDDEKMSWSINRMTTKEEDQAYCLMGLFDIYLPVLYGEGKRNALERLREAMAKRSSGTTTAEWSDKERDCMQFLRSSAFNYEQFKDRNSNRLEGTCEWVLRHQNFKNWKENGSSSLLWISADPGCGKSILSKSLVDIDLKPSDARMTCYFFFKDDNEEQKNAATALSAILHQLFCRKPMLIKYAMPEFATNGNKLPQLFHSLWDILTNVVADPEAGEIFCVLDALDECKEDGRYQIINTLSTYYQSHPPKKASRLKICITSRPYLDIERRFTDLMSRFPTIRLFGEQESDTISHEIDLVIRWRVSQLRSELKLTALEASQLEAELLGMSHRTYLWLTLIFDIIRKLNRPTSRKLKAVIGTLPSTVDSAYEAILAKIEEDDRAIAQKLLHIIVAATRPLTLKEMNIALAIESHHGSHNDLEPDLEDESRFEASVRNLCGLFVAVVDHKIYLIHQTAKEFLLSKSVVVAAGWKNSLDPKESETLLASICLSYLLFTDFDRVTNYPTLKYGYLDYAAKYWTIHYRKAHESAQERMKQHVVKICNIQSSRFATWFREHWSGTHWWHSPPKFTSLLMVASCLGLETIVASLLPDEMDVDKRNDAGQTPLLLAAKNGHEAVVRLLLDFEADVDLKDNDGKTPLWCAAAGGHDAIVKLLLTKNADIDVKDKYGWTPLLRSIRVGNEAVVKILLNNNADVSLKNNQGWTPLLQAASNGHEAVVKLLLGSQADLESKNNYGQTPLSQAVQKGYEAVVKLLLDSKADPESKNNYGQTPLSQAAQKGLEAVVKLLLDSQADLESKNNYGQTPLSQAAEYGHEAVVKLLLDSQADLEAKNIYEQTPLLQAAESGHEAVVKLLLDSQADLESKNNYRQTPLSQAAQKGHEAVVKLLLDSQADLESKNNYGQTPLSLATEYGHEAVVKLLLDSKADLESKNIYGRTPLSQAARRGHKAVVKKLLASQANVSSRDNSEWTPLSWAAGNGHKGVVKLLLDKRAEVDCKDNSGKTPLFRAAINGHEAMTKVLLNSQADVNSIDNDERTPLSWAASNGHKAVASLLLDSGANVHFKDKYGRTPLLWASGNGHHAVVKLLLDSCANVNTKDGNRLTLLKPPVPE